MKNSTQEKSFKSYQNIRKCLQDRLWVWFQESKHVRFSKLWGSNISYMYCKFVENLQRIFANWFVKIERIIKFYEYKFTVLLQKVIWQFYIHNIRNICNIRKQSWQFYAVWIERILRLGQMFVVQILRFDSDLWEYIFTNIGIFSII